MEEYTLDQWWASLTVEDKERIGRKITHNPDLHYPDVSNAWNQCTEETKQRIHDHCVDKHGNIMTAWTEGETFSY